MAEWENMPAWENRNGQYMTSRWLNRVVHNMDWLNGYFCYGASPFRKVRRRASPHDTPEHVWGTLWRGVYRHLNRRLVGVYAIFRGSSIAFDDDHAYEFRDNYMPSGHATEPTEIIVELSDHTQQWKTVYHGSHTTEGIYGFDVDLPAVAGLVLAPGNLYNVRVRGLNGGFEVSRIHAEGSASHTWPSLPNPADGQVLSHAQWNAYLDALAYLKEIADSPRGPTQGVFDKRGRRMTNNADSTSWRGCIKHRANTLKYRFGARQDSGHEDSGAHVYLYFNNVLIASGGANPGGADSAQQRLAEQYRYTEGSFDLAPLGLTAGNWYDLELRCDAENDYEYRVCIDYLFEVDGEPPAPIQSQRWQHGYFVAGNSGSPNVATWNADLAALKALADQHVQPVCPDQSTLIAELPNDGDRPNDLSFLRQRPILWCGGTNVVVYWGDPSSPQQESVGSGTLIPVGLPALSDLDVGVRYWLTPRNNVNYGLEI